MLDPFASIAGQPRAVEALRAAVVQPVHAYLFVGPAGSGKQDAARAFASALLHDERPMRDLHPDVVTVEREGAAINVAQAREISRIASLSPIEGKRKVVILTEFHLVDEAAPALLKTIEEATPTTVFVVLADSLTRELVTIASRCVTVEFRSIAPEVIAARLIEEGVPAERAQHAAENAFGNLTRARVLAVDDAVVARHELWQAALGRLDGRGSAAAELAAEVSAALDLATQPLLRILGEEVDAMRAQAKETGITATAAKTIEASQKRQVRRLRTDELRAGFATLSAQLGERFRSADNAQEVRTLQAQLDAVQWANEALQFNPTESLLLQGLFVRLSKAA